MRVAAVLVLSTACVAGAPPGFSKGDSWTIPLVGALEDGELVTVVSVNDHGPYLFAIDPDAPVSSIDEGIVSEVNAYHVVTEHDDLFQERYDDEQDVSHPTITADALTLRLGSDLTVAHHPLWVTHVGLFDARRRHIRGVIGHDIIADSIVFGFDRDKGVAYLSVPKAFTPPAGAATLHYHFLPSHLTDKGKNTESATMVAPVGRRLTDATIGGKALHMHVDLGAVASQLREGFWQAAGLTPVAAHGEVVDEIGTHRAIAQGAIAAQVRAGDLTAHGVAFVPYDDRRWEREDIDGTLGLDFFQGYNVWMNLDSHVVYAVPRSADLSAGTKARIARWGSQVLSSCPHTACFDLSDVSPPPDQVATDAPGAQPTGPLIHLQRDPDALDLNVEVTMVAIGKDGTPMPGIMVADFAKGVDTMTTQLGPEYAGSTVTIVDASPFVRECQELGKPCLFTLTGD
jgi:hypothetical protein